MSDLLSPEEADALAAPFRKLLPAPAPTLKPPTPKTLEEYRRIEPTLTRPVGDHLPRRLPLIIVVEPPPNADDQNRLRQRTYWHERRRTNDE